MHGFSYFSLTLKSECDASLCDESFTFQSLLLVKSNIQIQSKFTTTIRRRAYFVILGSNVTSKSSIGVILLYLQPLMIALKCVLDYITFIMSM